MLTHVAGALLERNAESRLPIGRERDPWLRRMAMRGSRTALTSGELEPVLDSGGSGHSVFARAVLNVLKDNNDILDGSSLFDKVKFIVARKANQTPRYDDIRSLKHDGGDFILVPSNLKRVLEVEPDAVDFFNSGINAVLYIHEASFTKSDAYEMQSKLGKYGIPSEIFQHRDPNAPDAIFIGSNVTATAAKLVISLVPYEIKYIFNPEHYPDAEGGDSSGLRIGIGYMSTHYQASRGRESEPKEISTKEIEYLTEEGITDAEFRSRLKKVTKLD